MREMLDCGTDKADLVGWVGRVFSIKMNGKHTTGEIGKHNIRLLNSYLGLLRLVPKHFPEFDHANRRILHCTRSAYNLLAWNACIS